MMMGVSWTMVTKGHYEASVNGCTYSVIRGLRGGWALLVNGAYERAVVSLASGKRTAERLAR